MIRYDDVVVGPRPTLAEIQQFNKDALANELRVATRKQNERDRRFNMDWRMERTPLAKGLGSVVFWRWLASRSLEKLAKRLYP